MIVPEKFSLNNHKCWICGYRKLDVEKKMSPRYLCFWCSPSEEGEEQLTPELLINDLILEAGEHLRNGNLIRCEDIDVLSLIADIGDLGGRHPHFKQFTSMIGLIAVQVVLEKSYTPRKLLKVAEGATLNEKWKRVCQCIFFLTDVSLLEHGEGRYIQDRFRPSNLLLELTSSIESVSKVEEELPPRIANCIAGYALLYGIKTSIEWLKKDGQGEPTGIIRLYPRNSHGKIWIPKRFTATTMYLMGHLAHGYDEFSENELRAWLSNREITGNDASWIINWLNRTIPSAHRLVNPRFDGIAYHFSFNLNYVRMRERFRERIRGRSR